MRGSFWMLICALTFLGACTKQDTKRELLDTADRRIKVGAYREAIRAYESALDGAEGTADLHYKMAVLYDDKLKEPLDAIHHYERYLDFSPNGRYAKEAKAAKADCEKRLQAKMSSQGFMSVSEGARLRSENDRLSRQVAEYRAARGPTPPRTLQPGAVDKIPPGSKEHTVAPGETLGSIALKYYKSKSMADHIKDANFFRLGGKDTIFPGQVLIIPEAPKRRR